MSRLGSGSATDKGRIRPTNEDRLVVTPHLIAVADGMGGHVGGEVAARTAVETLLSAFGAKRSSEDLLSAVQEANTAIWERSRSGGELRGMGTTLTAMALVSDGGVERLTLVNVGDSRAYLFDSGVLTQLTQDHSLVEEMVRDGELTPDEALVHPHRHILTRALGIDRGVEIDAWRLEPTDGDRVLICSDGLTNELSEDEIADVLGAEPDPEEAASELVRMAVEHGGNDNVTAVVVDISGVGDPDAEPSPRQPRAKAAAAPAGVGEAARRRKGGPRKPGLAGSTQGLTGFVPVVGAGVEAAAALAEAASAAAEAGAAAAGAGAGSKLTASRGSGSTGAQSVTGGTGVDPGPPTSAMSAPDLGNGTMMIPVVPHSELDDLPTYGRSPDRAPDLGANASYVEGSAVAQRRRATLGEPAPATGIVPAVEVPTSAPRGEEHHGRPMVLVAPKRERRTTRAERVMSGRVALFALLLVGILGGAAGAVGWYVQNSYFVGISGKEIVIYHGRPGGLLWFQPSLIEHTGISTSQIIPPVLPTLRAGVEEPTLQAAQQLVSKLTSDTSLLPLFSSTTTVPPSTVPSGISTTTTSSPVSSTSIVTEPTFPTASTTSIPSTTTTTTTPKSGTTTTTTTTTPTTTTAPGHGKGHK